MDIIEAVKSGKRFKRPHWCGWLSLENKDYNVQLNGIDVLADDWIIEEEKIELTRTAIELAWNRCGPGKWSREELFRAFVLELGFKD